MAKMRKLFAVVATVTVVASTMVACSTSQPGEMTQGEQVLLMTASKPEVGKLELTTAFVGNIQPSQIVSVIPKTVGTVEKIHVKTGDVVKKGDLLLTIDSKDIMPSYNQAKASYDSAVAQANQMTGSSYKSQLANLDTAYDSAYDSYAQAKDSASDLADLLKQKKALEEKLKDPTLSEDDKTIIRDTIERMGDVEGNLEKAEDAVALTRKYYINAKNSYEAMKVEGQEDIKAVADATLKMAESGLQLAKQQLDNTKIYAPIDGVVETISATELNIISNQGPAFVISNKDALMVTFSVTSSAVATLKAGDAITMEKGSKVYSGTITNVDTMLNAQTGLFTVKATVDTAAPELLTGVSVKVNAVTERAENALLVNQDSVYFDDGLAYLYVVDGDVARKVYVETGISTPKQIEVLSGITADDMVITSWNPNLLDGVKVTITEPSTTE